MRQISLNVFAALLSLMWSGCVVGGDTTGEDGEEVSLDAESVPLGPNALSGGVYDVGVIPGYGQSCPAGSAEITIRMDDEDTNNHDSVTGWVGKTMLISGNTTFDFCKVDGAQFLPLSTINNSTNHYAVLKLGTNCPQGSEEFTRTFDNEDKNNKNSYTGDIYPNVSTANTKLYFCLFRYAASGVSTMASFPDLGVGFSYGVFGGSTFVKSLSSGVLHTDDEDSGNKNGYSPVGNLEAQAIVSKGSNTDLRMVQVK